MSTQELRPRSPGDRIRWLLRSWRPRTQRARRRTLVAADACFVVMFGLPVLPEDLADGILALALSVFVVALVSAAVLVAGIRREFRTFYAKPTELDEREFSQVDSARAAAFVPTLVVIGCALSATGAALNYGVSSEIIVPVTTAMSLLVLLATTLAPLHVLAWRQPDMPPALDA